MALARIITRFAEQAQDLAAQLRTRGYEVEILSPEQAGETAVDLEIKLDECSIDEALSQASLSAERDLSIVIAPRAIAGDRPVTGMAPVNPMNAAREHDEWENLISLPRVQAVQAQTQRETGRENFERQDEFAAQFPLEQSAEPPEVYVYQDARLSPLERLRLPRIRLPEFSLPAFSWHLPRVKVPRPGISFHVPNLRFRIRKPELHLPRFSWPHLTLRIPRIKVRVPRLSLRIPTIAVRVPRMSWRMPNVRVPKFSLPVRQRVTATPSASASLLQSPLPARPRTSNALFWDSAIAFGILAVSVLMVGGLLHSKTPLPARLTQQSENSTQKVPFAKVKPAATSAPPSAPSSVRALSDENVKAAPIAAPEPAGEKKPSAQVAQRRTGRERQAAKSRTRSSGPVKLAQRPRSSEQGSDYVAEDTVVHYGKNN